MVFLHAQNSSSYPNNWELELNRPNQSGYGPQRFHWYFFWLKWSGSGLWNSSKVWFVFLSCPVNHYGVSAVLIKVGKYNLFNKNLWGECSFLSCLTDNLKYLSVLRCWLSACYALGPVVSRREIWPPVGFFFLLSNKYQLFLSLFNKMVTLHTIVQWGIVSGSWKRLTWSAEKRPSCIRGRDTPSAHLK